MKVLKWIGIILGSLVVIGWVSMQILTYNTKKASPEKVAEFKDQSMEITVNYCSPAKKGRDIFGALVPYGEVWRTGANEATTLTCSKEMVIEGKVIPAGTYTLFTIPEASEWTLIFNSKEYPWGLNWDGTTVREPEFDVAKFKVPSYTLDEVIENFTIDLEYNVNLTMAWDKTKISVPIAYQP